MKLHAIMLALPLLLASSAAFAQAPPPGPRAELPSIAAEPRPSSRVGFLVTGGIFMGVGVLNLLTAPLCKVNDVVDKSAQDLCLGVSLAVGGTFLLIGIPLLGIGVTRRAELQEWKRRHGLVGFAPARGGGALTWQLAF